MQKMGNYLKVLWCNIVYTPADDQLQNANHNQENSTIIRQCVLQSDRNSQLAFRFLFIAK